jgi:hypothetical protein
MPVNKTKKASKGDDNEFGTKTPAVAHHANSDDGGPIGGGAA